MLHAYVVNSHSENARSASRRALIGQCHLSRASSAVFQLQPSSLSALDWQLDVWNTAQLQLHYAQAILAEARSLSELAIKAGDLALKQRAA